MTKVLADENIPYGEEAFSTIGEVTLKSGRAITKQDLEGIEVLMVRSVTEVNRELLEGTDVRFVGTATIGTDHIDQDYLKEAGIGFSSAPGCNANSVSEYIMAVILEMAGKYNFNPVEKKLGIIGVGNVGSIVEEKACALGMNVILNDPPLRDATGDEKYRPLEEIFNADIVTLHVPLTKDGDYPTYHMTDASFFEKLGPGKAFINASRGSVVDESVLSSVIDNGSLLFTALDVWENEPGIDPGMLKKVDIGTPHIAGYSFEGKVTGTYMIYNAACEHLGIPSEWSFESVMGEKEAVKLLLLGSVPKDMLRTVRINYDIMNDDRILKGSCEQDDLAAEFDRLRKEYPKRREFMHTIIDPCEDISKEILDILEKFKFDMTLCKEL